MTIHTRRRLWNKIEVMIWGAGMALAFGSALLWMATSALPGTVMFKNQPTPVYYHSVPEEVEV